ncbi:MAG: sensor histidine kinase [Planctomycetota bacterium]|jgi:signal transduction histidine kinase
MNKKEARRLLASADEEDRRRGARHLEKKATRPDLSFLKRAIAKERDPWTKRALQRGLRRAEGVADDDQANDAESDVERGRVIEIHGRAVEETTRLILHEIEPIVGTLQLHAEREIDNYAGSSVARDIARLDEVLSALMTLNRAASTPKIETFDLYDLVSGIVEDEKGDVDVELVGRQPLVVSGDPRLVGIAFRNGLRNSIEATLEAGHDELPPVTVSWGDTNREGWITILDRGKGLAAGFEHAFKIGRTTKPQHRGMGLATAKRAVESLGGTISLGPSEGHGARFEVRWPLRLADEE